MGASSIYQIETLFDRYTSVAYNWGDTSHPDTVQSFALSGKGLIDQSIFPFQRRKDAWSLGAYCTTFALGSSYDTINMRAHPNKLSKNNAFLINNTVATTGHMNPNYYIDSNRYSPTPTFSGWSPWYNFPYTKVRIYPKFYMIDSSGNTYGPWDYNEVVANGASSYNCWCITVEFFGAPTYTSAFNPHIVQYAGTITRVVETYIGYDLYTLAFGDDDVGVYYAQMPFGMIFQGLAVQNGNKIGPSATKTYAQFFDFTQMDWEMVHMSSNDAYMFSISFRDAEKIISSFGFYWCKDADAKLSEGGINCTDPDLCCPIIDPDTHMVTETVLSGTDIADYAEAHIDDPFCNFTLDFGNVDENDNPIGATTDEYRDNYDPNPSTTEPADEIDLNEPVVATSGGTSVWLMNESKLLDFFTYLWNPDGTVFDDIVKSCALFGENPMDSVISCRFFPLDLANVFNSHFDSVYRTIVFGRKATGVMARHLETSNVAVYNLGSFFFNDSGMFKDFRDYEPYSQYFLYLPFVGIVPLAAIECINAEISIKYIIDLITGACTAVVYTNGVPYKYIDGMIGIEIPVTGRNMAQYGQQILGAAMGGALPGVIKGGKIGESMMEGGYSASGNMFRKAGNNFANGRELRGTMHVGAGVAAGTAATLAPVVLGAAYGIAGGGVAGAASALLNNPSPEMSGSNVPAMGLAKPLFAYLIVQRSDSWIPENYAKLHGRPLQQGGKVGDFTGFSTFGNLKLENIGTATSEEKVLISEILAKGVYI